MISLNFLMLRLYFFFGLFLHNFHVEKSRTQYISIHSIHRLSIYVLFDFVSKKIHRSKTYRKVFAFLTNKPVNYYNLIKFYYPPSPTNTTLLYYSTFTLTTLHSKHFDFQLISAHEVSSFYTHVLWTII